jgi:hypothetical protein
MRVLKEFLQCLASQGASWVRGILSVWSTSPVAGTMILSSNSSGYFGHIVMCESGLDALGKLAC